MKKLPIYLGILFISLMVIGIPIYVLIVVSAHSRIESIHGQQKNQELSWNFRQEEQIDQNNLETSITATPFITNTFIDPVKTSVAGFPTKIELLTSTPSLIRSYSTTPALSPSPTSTPSPTLVPPTATLEPTLTPIPIERETFPPSSSLIEGFVGNAQLYSLDCEARSAVDLAGYYGVYIDENDFLSKLPRSDDPTEGFVGSVTDRRGRIPPESYGVYAGPIAETLQSYGVKALEEYGLSWDYVRSEIASGRPVMLWVVGNTWSGSRGVIYTSSNGHTTIVVNWEHTVIGIGYTPEYITLVDGDMTYKRTIAQFLDSWGVLGNMAVTVQP